MDAPRHSQPSPPAPDSRKRGIAIRERIAKRSRDASGATRAWAFLFFAPILCLAIAGAIGFAGLLIFAAGHGVKTLSVAMGALLALFYCVLSRASVRHTLWRTAYRASQPLFRMLGTRAAQTCAYCRDELVTGAPRECPDCAAAYHGECLDEFGGCATLGCPSRHESPRASPLHGAKQPTAAKA